jgi:hypothetical protein
VRGGWGGGVLRKISITYGMVAVVDGLVDVLGRGGSGVLLGVPALCVEGLQGEG